MYLSARRYVDAIADLQRALAIRVRIHGPVHYKVAFADVLLAGYAPPPDSRLLTLGLASDPGVLEVNLIPCATWEDYDRQLRKLYRAAARVGLRAGKLQFNGRATGTGAQQLADDREPVNKRLCVREALLFTLCNHVCRLKQERQQLPRHLPNVDHDCIVAVAPVRLSSASWRIRVSPLVLVC